MWREEGMVEAVSTQRVAGGALIKVEGNGDTLCAAAEEGKVNEGDERVAVKALFVCDNC